MYNLWEIRQRKGMTLNALSARTGIPVRVLQDYEYGRKPIPYEDLSRIARALYVEEWEIKTQSDPPPEAEAATAEKAQAPAAKAQPARPKGKPRTRATPRRRPRRSPPPPAPVRETQLAQMRQLAPHLGLTLEDLERMAGKPLEQLTRREAARILFQMQETLRERKKKEKEEGTHNRKRAYLPEGVDRFELEYLTQLQKTGEPVRFHLFDGTEVVGQVVGFSPYSITVRTENGEETTLNKLAIAWYTRERQNGAEEAGASEATEAAPEATPEEETP